MPLCIPCSGYVDYSRQHWSSQLQNDPFAQPIAKLANMMHHV